MSDASIPKSNGNLKPLTLDGLIKRAERTKKVVERANGRLGPGSPVNFEVMVIPGPGATSTPSGTDARSPRRRPPRKSGLYAVLHAAQQHGLTHPNVGAFLRLPREFDAILALEQKAVAQVVLEVLRQTIGTVDYGDDRTPRHREWAVISQRHFARAGLMTNKAAWRGIEGALEKGYIQRREIGSRRFAYAIRWRGTN
jgi:hypothetical protein